MNDDFVFPNDWLLKIDDENIDLVNDWRRYIVRHSNSNCTFEFIRPDGSGDVYRPEYQLPKITTSQFMKYVLKVDILVSSEKVVEDLGYLKVLFKKLNIK